MQFQESSFVRSLGRAAIHTLVDEHITLIAVLSNRVFRYDSN